MPGITEIIATLVRLTSILLLVQTIRFAVNNSYWVFGYDETPAITVTLVIMFLILMFLLVVLLWRFPLQIARRIIPVIDEKDVSRRVSMTELQASAISVAGLVLLVLSIADACYWYVYLGVKEQQELMGSGLGPDIYASITATSLKIVISLFLILGSKGIVTAINKLRYAGTNN